MEGQWRGDDTHAQIIFLLTRIIYFSLMVEKGECILTHELHCTYIYTITYNPQLNVTHKLITHRFLITSLFLCECIPERKNCYYRWSSYSAEWEKLFRLQMYLCVQFVLFLRVD